MWTSRPNGQGCPRRCDALARRPRLRRSRATEDHRFGRTHAAARRPTRPDDADAALAHLAALVDATLEARAAAPPKRAPASPPAALDGGTASIEAATTGNEYDDYDDDFDDEE